MARKNESFVQREARRQRQELTATASALRSMSAQARPLVALPALVQTGADQYGRPGSHEYGFWQPAIPGSERWIRERGLNRRKEA